MYSIAAIAVSPFRKSIGLLLLLRTLLFSFLFLIFSAPDRANAETDSPQLRDHVLIVYNSLQNESTSLAKYYAEHRGIPSDHLLGIRCSGDEEITRTEFKDHIQEPIRNYLLKNKWMDSVDAKSPFGDQTLPVKSATFNKIWCIVLMRGVPLKIANDPSIVEQPTNYAGMNTNAASVDSELTLLPIVGLPLIGVLPNPYELLGYNRAFDSLDARQMIMVGRLDGPSANDVRRMIDDALYAEAHRLTGRAAIDARGLNDENSGYYQGDQWLLNSSDELIKNGWEVAVDHKPELFPENLPWRSIAIYAGWYQQNASGPFMRKTGPPTFARGAIAYHIHSFSAATLRSTTSNWCGPLIAKGAAATMGAVYEPYLDFTPRWDVFLHRLLSGSTFIEAAYGSQKVLSWMTTFVGDPLYTPFAIPLEKAIASAPVASEERDFLRLQSIRFDLAAGKLDAVRASLSQLLSDPKLTFVAWEGYGDILSDPRLLPPNATVANAYERAFNLSTTVEDQVRTNLKAAYAFEQRFREKDAKRLLDLMLYRYPNEAVYFGVQNVLKQLNASGGIPLPADMDPHSPVVSSDGQVRLDTSHP